MVWTTPLVITPQGALANRAARSPIAKVLLVPSGYRSIACGCCGKDPLPQSGCCSTVHRPRNTRRNRSSAAPSEYQPRGASGPV